TAGYRTELVLTSGRRVPLPEFRLDPATGSAGQTIPVDLDQVARVELSHPGRTDMLTAALGEHRPSSSGNAGPGGPGSLAGICPKGAKPAVSSHAQRLRGTPALAGRVPLRVFAPKGKTRSVQPRPAASGNAGPGGPGSLAGICPKGQNPRCGF